MVPQRNAFAGLFVVGVHGSGGLVYEAGVLQKGDLEDRKGSNSESHP